MTKIQIRRVIFVLATLRIPFKLKRETQNTFNIEFDQKYKDQILRSLGAWY